MGLLAGADDLLAQERRSETVQWLMESVIVVSMLAVNAVFAAYEMALASVSRARLEALVQMNRRGARSAARMKGQMERSLAVVQVGITLAGAIAAATGGAGVEEYLAPSLAARFDLQASTAAVLALALFVIPLSAVIIVFAELVPKMFAIRNKEFVLLTLSPVMWALSLVTYPAIVVLERTVKRIISFGERKKLVPESRADENAGLVELKAAASLAKSSRLIGALEEKIVHAAARLSTRPVREAMLPADQIVTIPEQASLADALILAHIHMHTRYPTCAREGDPQSITGYVNFKDIVAALKMARGEPGLKGVIRPIKRIPEHVTMSTALEQMIRESAHIACVTRADGVVLGLLTMEDIMEELVGDIGDEYDRLPTYMHSLTGGWIVGGGISMQQLAQEAGTDASAFPAGTRTLAGWCEAHHPAPLRIENVLCADGLEVQVRKMRRGRVLEAMVRLSAPQRDRVPS